MRRFNAEELAVESAKEKLLEAERNLAEAKSKQEPIVIKLAALIHNATCQQDHVGNCVGATSSKTAYEHDYDNEHTEKRYYKKAENLIEAFPDLTVWQITKMARMILD